MIFFYFCFGECILHTWLWYKNTVLLSLHRNYIKFIRATRRNALLGHVSYKYTEQNFKQYHRILLDFPQILSLLFQFLLLFFCLHVLFKLRIYILIQIRLCGRVSGFHPADFRKQDYFFYLCN